MHELLCKESTLLDQVALKIEEDRKLRRKHLKEEIEEVRRLKEIECKELAEAGYRKQTTMNRDNYRPMLNKLYAQDLNAQIELNKLIEAHENRKEENIPKTVSLPVSCNCENGNSGPKRDLKEQLRKAMSVREAKLLEIAKQKKMEAEEMRECEEICLCEKVEAAKAAHEWKMMLRSSFDQRIKEMNQDLGRKKVEDARTSACLTSNAIRKAYATEEKLFQDKAVAKHRALALFEYAKQLGKEKQLEEKEGERAMERTTRDIIEANETKQRQLRETSCALEKEIKREKLKQVQEKGEKSTVSATDGSPSFLDKMLAESDHLFEEARVARKEKSHSIQQQIAQKARFTDWRMEDREFTRSFQRSPQGDLDTYEYLNPLRKLSLKDLKLERRLH